MAGRVVIAGALAQRPRRGGHAWVFLQYLLGFRRLGYEVLFLDRLEPAMSPCSQACLGYLEGVMETFGLAYAARCDGAEETVGLSRSEVLARVAESDVLLDFMGFLGDDEVLAEAPLRVYVDIDPGFGQMWRELGWHDPYGHHDRYVTVGENIGDADCTIPTCGIEWITTRQPVVLAEWPRANGGDGAFTSVGSWRGPYDPIPYDGVTYGLRAHEFRKFAELPRLTAHSLEIALDIDPADVRDLRLLGDRGWLLVDPTRVAGDPHSYRTYVQTSKAELAVAKGMYVQTNSGWFSDRSICYLASGKPVVAQRTGFERHCPTGRGVLTFETIDEAVDAVDEVSSEYRAHSDAARILAEEHFDSDRVLDELLAKLGS
jgi:hypothetical protein